MSNFEKAFEIIIGHEGGYTADPRDRGNWDTGVIGKGTLKGTKYGVSAMSYPHLDIKNLTLDDARRIYRANYWDAIGADQLPAPLALDAFDTAVNSGVGRAKQFLAQTRDWQKYLDLRLNFMRSLGTWATYGRGWQKRVDTLRKQCATFGAQPAPAPQGRVLLVPLGGGEPVPWDGKPTKYGGVLLDAALVEQLRLVYPSPGGPWTYQTIKLWHQQDGDLVLERLPVTPGTIPATPPK